MAATAHAHINSPLAAAASSAATFYMDVFADHFDPSELLEAAQEDVIVLTWKGDERPTTVTTSQHTAEGDHPFELFKGGKGPDQDEYTITNDGGPFTIKDDVPTGEYHVKLATGVRATIHVRRRSQRTIAVS